VAITVDVKPEVEAELAAQAKARGMHVTAYASSLLENAIHATEKSQAPQGRKQSLSEFLMNSPLAGSELILERDKDTGRDIEL